MMSGIAHAQGPDSSNAPIKVAISPDADESLENFPGFRKFYKNSQLTIIPIPVFSTMPDEGQTYGLMPTLLISSQSGKAMRSIISPMIGYNSIIKTMGSAAVLFFPSKSATLSLFAGAAQEFYQEYELIFTDKKAFNGNFFFEATSRYYNNPFGRFFGLGPTAPKTAKAYYTAGTYLSSVNIAYNFSPHLRLGLLEKFYLVDLKSPLPGKGPDVQTAFGPTQGVFDNHNLTNSVYAAFNSHGFNATDTPFSLTEGSAAFFFSTVGMGGESSYSGADGIVKQTFAYGPQRLFSTVLRLHYKQIAGDSAPFYEMPSLGGPNELRGYTAGRFVDKGALIFQLEQRNRVAHINFFSRAEGEFFIDPFFEVGQVFHAGSDIRWNNLQPVGGLGFRVDIKPSLVARVDVGFSREENFQVFTVLNYPF
jgi:outer membrane protein assembly factor BamA